MKTDSIVLGFAGKIASGKSTISTGLAKMLDWPYVSFGNYVRLVARERGLDQSQRRILQQIGKTLVEADCEGFCRAVIAQAKEWQPGKPLVIDGVRHLQVKKVIEKLVAPSRFILVYISVAEEIRLQRLLKEEKSIEALESLELMSTEVQAKSELIEAADIVLDGMVALDLIIEELKTKIFSGSEAL